MKRTAAILTSLLAMIFLSSCGGTSSGGSNTNPTANATVNFVVSDTPSPKLTVLSFQIQITGAVLQPGNVSLLKQPVTVDLAQLVSDTGFLSSTVVDSKTFTSMTMTVANAQVTIINNSGAAIVTPTQTCAVNAVCTFTPKLNTASLTISSGVFPITLTANSSTGLALDLSIPDLLQSDLSITLADGSSVNLSLLPEPTANGEQAQIADVLGLVKSASTGQVQITTALGASLVLTTDANTSYNFPESVCETSGSACLAANQVVTTDLSLLADGGLHANSITFAGAPGTTVAKGVIVAVNNTAPPTMQMLVHGVVPSSTQFQIGDVVDVSVENGAAFSVTAPSYPAVSGGTFASASDLLAGQEVAVQDSQQLTTEADGNPAFESAAFELGSSQIVGQVTSVNAAAQSFALTNVWSLFTTLSPAVPSLQAQTGTQTSFVNLTPASFSAVTVGANLSVKGPLFNTTDGSGQPTMAALQVTARQ